jgi:hypothetical protein
MGGLGPGEGHDTGRVGTGGHGRIGHELGTSGLGTVGLCPNVPGTH